MSQSKMAIITFLDGSPVDPGFGVTPPVYPSTGPIYGGGHPGHALPPPGSIATLPVFPFDPTRPDNALPPAPDNTLPGGPPPTATPPIYRPIVPGARFVVKYLACQGLILVPDNSLPQTPEPK